MRYFEISPENTSNVGATVRLYYDAAQEANGIVPSSVMIYHCAGGTWENLGGTTGSDANGNYVQVQGVSSFSPFAMSGTNVAPTSAELLSASAKLDKKGKVQVHWETGSELTIVGFNVQRSNKRNGAYKPLNAEQIAAQATGTPSGAKYKYQDKHVKKGKKYFYRVELILADNTTKLSDILVVKVP
jgi:hypothetical protein